MPATNKWNSFLIGLILLLCILGCKSAEEKERQQQRAAERQEKANQKQKTQDVIKALEADLDGWAKLAPPVKLTKEPYIKEKIVIVYRRAEGINEVLEGDVVEWESCTQVLLPKSRQLFKPTVFNSGGAVT